jgi:hypothetical protein
MQSSMKIGEMMYKDAQDNQNADVEENASQESGEKVDNTVVDGDYKDLNK